MEPPLEADSATGRFVVPVFNAYSGSGVAEGEIVFAGYGLPADYRTLDSAGVSVRGNIVLARYGRSFRGIKAREAGLRGALGLLLAEVVKVNGIQVDPEDPFNIMYSSGTTGLPKGIVHTHAIRLAYATMGIAAFRIKPESVIMHAGAIVFNGAFVDLMPTVYQGGTYILLPQFDPHDFIETIIQEKVTHTMMVPSLLPLTIRVPSGDQRKLFTPSS